MEHDYLSGPEILEAKDFPKSEFLKEVEKLMSFIKEQNWQESRLSSRSIREGVYFTAIENFEKEIYNKFGPKINKNKRLFANIANQVNNLNIKSSKLTFYNVVWDAVSTLNNNKLRKDLFVSDKDIDHNMLLLSNLDVANIGFFGSLLSNFYLNLQNIEEEYSYDILYKNYHDCEEIIKQLHQRLRNIKNALQLEDLEKVEILALKLIYLAEESQRQLAYILAFLDIYIDEVTHESNSLNELPLDAAYAARITILCYLFGYYILDIVAKGEDSEGFKAEIVKANRLGLDSKIINGTSISIKEIIRDAQKYQGQLLQVSAFVKYCEDEGEYILSDRKDHGQIYTRLHLRRSQRAMIDGCFVRLTGKLEIINDKIYIESQEIDFEKLKEDSWFDSIIDNMGEYFSLYPNDLNLIYSFKNSNIEKEIFSLYKFL